MRSKIHAVPPFKGLAQSNETKDIIINLFVESTKYTASKIDNTNSKDQFVKTCKRIQEILYYTFDGATPFKRSKSNLVILQGTIRRTREINSSFFDFFEPKKTYDETAFNIAFDILNKIEIRFVTGYV